MTYSRLGVDSNGYIVVGGGTAGGQQLLHPHAVPEPGPAEQRAGAVLDGPRRHRGTGHPRRDLTDGVDTWIVVEWQVNVFGTTSNRHFQVWIGIDGAEDITYAYDPAALPADPGPLRSTWAPRTTTARAAAHRRPADRGPAGHLDSRRAGRDALLHVHGGRRHRWPGVDPDVDANTAFPGTALVTNDITVAP